MVIIDVKTKLWFNTMKKGLHNISALFQSHSHVVKLIQVESLYTRANRPIKKVMN